MIASPVKASVISWATAETPVRQIMRTVNMVEGMSLIAASPVVLSCFRCADQCEE